jgi:hypothetical protein
MRVAASLVAVGIVSLSFLTMAACGSSDSNGSNGSSGSSGSNENDGSTTDGGKADAPPGADAQGQDQNAPDSGVPSVQYIGRFDDSDALGPKTAWPGSRIVARFDGTAVSAKLTQMDGPSGGPSFFNVVVDGAVTKTISVTGTQTIDLATGLAPGVHTIELEKRTESIFGTVRFEGYTFTGGQGLLAPKARLPRRIEFLGDSTIDGFGVDGDRTTTCPSNTAPPQLNDVRKSFPWRAADLLGAEHHLITYDGKGMARNADGSTTNTFPIVYARTLPDVDGAWPFSSFFPDVVVIVVGGADWNGTDLPSDLQTTYNLFLTAQHARYGATMPLILTLGAQVHGAARPALEAIIDAVIAGRPNADKPHNHKLVLPEAQASDETGCKDHTNAAHHAAMAPLVVAEIKKWTGW